MRTLKAKVINGRLVMDEPSDLPEGTELELTMVEDDDEASEGERAALHQALTAAWSDLTAGKGRPAKEFLAELRRKG